MVIFLLVFQWLRILLEIYDTSMIGTTDFLRKFHRFHYFLLPHSFIGSIELSVVKKMYIALLSYLIAKNGKI